MSYYDALLLQKLNKKHEIKSKKITFTTNSYGYGGLNMLGIIPLFMYDDASLHLFDFFNYSNGVIGASVRNATNLSIVASTEISGTLYYIET